MCVVNKYCAWLVPVSMGLELDYAVNFTGISVAVRCGLVAVRGVELAFFLTVVCVCCE